MGQSGGETRKPMDVDRMHTNVARFGSNGPNATGDSIDALFHQGVDWIELMKSVRQIHDVSLDEATRLVLAHDGWRRWVTQRINTDARCRKMAVTYMRDGEAASPIEQHGSRLRVRAAATGVRGLPYS